jgi:hypothetical protein
LRFCSTATTRGVDSAGGSDAAQRITKNVVARCYGHRPRLDRRRLAAKSDCFTGFRDCRGFRRAGMDLA